MSNKENMIAKFIYEYRQSETNEKIPPKKQLDYWYKIITDNIYNEKHTKEEKLLACEFIKQIIEST